MEYTPATAKSKIIDYNAEGRYNQEIDYNVLHSAKVEDRAVKALVKYNKQQNFGYTGTAATSSAFDDNTVAIRISAQNDTSKIALIEIGTDPTASNTSMHIGTHTSGGSVWHDASLQWIEFYIDRGTSQKISFKDPASNSGKAQVIELKY